MRNEGPVEPGVLYTFRLFVTVQLCLTLLGLVGHWLLSFRAGSEIITLTTFSVIELAVLLAYLSIPGLQRLLRSAYLPVAIIMARTAPRGTKSSRTDRLKNTPHTQATTK